MLKNTFLLATLLLFTYTLPAQIIPFGTTWKYLDNGSDQGTAWTATSFNDDAWKSGPAELGYGDGDEATVVSYGSDPSHKYATTYFRASFNITDLTEFSSFTGRLKRDDGAIVYVNGKEIYRTNMLTGPVFYNTYAHAAAGDEDGRAIHEFPIDVNSLVTGTNVIAVEIHQYKPSNSDISFDFELVGAASSGGPTDQTPPSVQSINRFSPADDSTTSTSVTFRTSFSEPVTGVDASDFSLNGTAPGTIASVTGNGTTYDIKVNVTDTGSLRLDLNASGTGIADTAGNAINGGFSNGESYVIISNGSPDQTPPTVESINRFSPTSQTTTANTVTFRTTFSENVTGVDASDFTLTGSASASISSVSGTGSVYDIKVNVTGIGTLGLDLNASGTGITDEAGNAISGGFTEGETYDIVVSTQPNASLVHGPYLQMTSQTAVTVRWRTDVATDSKVDVGTAFSNYTITETDGKDTTNHEVRVTGLKADTKYYYRFGSSTQVLQAGQDNYFTTAPPVTTKRKIRVAAFGDCGSISSTVQQAVLKAYLNYTASNPAELMLLLGDNAYEDGTDSEYSSNFFKRYDGSILKNHNLFPVPGNHDYHLVPLTSRTSPYFNNFSLPTAGECGGVPSGSESYYSYNWGNIHFIALDSYGEESDNTHLYDTLGPQMTWLKKDLAANTNRWTIAYWHHPPFSKGTHNSDTESDLTKIRQKVIRILERYGVDIILCGHSHVYERSYLLRGYYGTEAEFDLTTDAVSSSSAKYDGSSNSCLYTTADGQVDHGTVYVVAGSASRSGSAVESTFPHDALPFATNDGGMFYFEVEDNRLDGKMIDMDGTVFDQFTIMKGVNNTTTQSVTAGSSATLTASWIGNYKWSTGATTRSITVTPSGDQTYTVTDDNSCLRDQFNVNVVTTLAAASPNVNIKSINNTSGLVSVYPTLVQKGRLISIRSNPMEVSDASMVDNNGRLVRRFKLAGSADLETGNLAAGSYFIIINNKNKISRYRVVVAE